MPKAYGLAPEEAEMLSHTDRLRVESPRGCVDTGSLWWSREQPEVLRGEGRPDDDYHRRRGSVGGQWPRFGLEPKG